MRRPRRPARSPHPHPRRGSEEGLPAPRLRDPRKRLPRRGCRGAPRSRRSARTPVAGRRDGTAPKRRSALVNTRATAGAHASMRGMYRGRGRNGGARVHRLRRGRGRRRTPRDPRQATGQRDLVPDERRRDLRVRGRARTTRSRVQRQPGPWPAREIAGRRWTADRRDADHRPDGSRCAAPRRPPQRGCVARVRLCG